MAWLPQLIDKDGLPQLIEQHSVDTITMSDKRKQYHASRADSGYAPPIAQIIPSLYTALDHQGRQVRFITVEPGFPEECIKCHVTIVSLLLDPLPPYETISYVWGNSSLRRSVIVDGHALDVPASTEHVLRRMRSTQQARVLWIDSICINQNDKADRDYQVALMCDIYSRATKCLIWIGEVDGEDIEQTFEEFQNLYDEARLRTNNFHTFKETVWPGWWSVYGEASGVVVNTDSMARFFDRPWFSRLW
jgi:hypothetical protein